MKTIVTELTRLYKNRDGQEEIKENATAVDILALLYELEGGEEEIPAGATSADIIGMIADVFEPEPEPQEEQPVVVDPIVETGSAEITPGGDTQVPEGNT